MAGAALSRQPALTIGKGPLTRNMAIERSFLNRGRLERLKKAASAITSAGSDATKHAVLAALGGRSGPEATAAAQAMVGHFWASGIPDYFTAVYGVPCALWLNFCTIRQHLPGDGSTHVTWHLDANFFGADRQSLVGWVPLDPVGTDAPGLDFCLPIQPISEQQAAPVREASGHFPKLFDDDAIRRAFGPNNTEIVTEPMNPGDIAFFDNSVLHRTQVLPATTRARIAIEFRMTSASRPATRHRQEANGTFSVRLPDGDFVVRPYRELFGDQ